MSAEKIIQQIKKDTEKQVKQITKEAKTHADQILNDAKKQSQKDSEKILENGKIQSENAKKILISQETQEQRRKIMKAQDEIIEECFSKATEKLAKLDKKSYEKTIETFIQKAVKQLGKNIQIITSKESDINPVKKHNLKHVGKTDSIGGLIIKSADGKITLDYTFEGILKREKDKIRIKIGKMLFS